jgi:hypothetical protein
MAYQNVSHHCLSLVAAGDLSAKQFHAIGVNSAGKAAIADADDQVIGIVQNNPAAGQAANVAFGGVSKAKLGGTVAAGARVTANASGEIVAASSAGDAVIGVALSGGASGEIVSILVHPFPFVTLA